jgi:hypothetical protein
MQCTLLLLKRLRPIRLWKGSSRLCPPFDAFRDARPPRRLDVVYLESIPYIPDGRSQNASIVMVASGEQEPKGATE